MVIALALFSFLSFLHHAPSWPNAVAKAEASIVRITGQKTFTTEDGFVYGGYICTGFLVDQGIALTANHCLGDHMLGDGKDMKLIAADPSIDLAAFSTDLNKPALQFADRAYTLEDVIGVGYAFGFDKPFLTSNRVVFPEYRPAEHWSGVFVAAGYDHGMSGGPVIDIQGHVVSMVQSAVMADENAGFGVSARTMQKFLSEIAHGR